MGAKAVHTGRRSGWGTRCGRYKTVSYGRTEVVGAERIGTPSPREGGGGGGNPMKCGTADVFASTLSWLWWCNRPASQSPKCANARTGFHWKRQSDNWIPNPNPAAQNSLMTAHLNTWGADRYEHTGVVVPLPRLRPSTACSCHNAPVLPSLSEPPVHV